MKEGRFPFEQSSNPRQSQSGRDPNLDLCQPRYTYQVKTMHQNHRLKMPATLFSQKGSRRDFLRNTAVTALIVT